MKLAHKEEFALNDDEMRLEIKCGCTIPYVVWRDANRTATATTHEWCSWRRVAWRSSALTGRNTTMI